MLGSVELKKNILQRVGNREKQKIYSVPICGEPATVGSRGAGRKRRYVFHQPPLLQTRGAFVVLTFWL